MHTNDFATRCQAYLANPTYEPYLRPLVEAADPRELAKAKRAVLRAVDSGVTDIPDGVWLYFWESRRAHLRSLNATSRSAAEARADRILRTRDSDGRAKARR